MKALILDTETTGLISNRLLPLDKLPYVIDLTAIRIDLSNGETEDELTALVKPPVAIPGEITKITGITDEMVADAQPFSFYVDRLEKMIKSVPLVIAHNAAFDRDMIEIEYERLGKQIEWPRVLCTVEATIGLFGYRLTLAKLFEHLFGLPAPTGAHRARQDVETLIACCKEMFHLGMI